MTNTKRIKELTKHEFMPYELTKEAFDTYCNSNFTFYQDSENNFYMTGNSFDSEAWLIGSIQDVENFLIEITED